MKQRPISIFAGCALLAFGASTQASAQAGQARAHMEQATFEVLDDNRDGAISSAEAMDLPELSQAFATLDTNRDGRLDHAEFGPAMAAALWGIGTGLKTRSGADVGDDLLGRRAAGAGGEGGGGGRELEKVPPPGREL